MTEEGMFIKPDYTDILNSCGGRLSIDDARILYQTAFTIGARTIVEIGSKDGCSSMVLGHIARENDGHLWCVEPYPTQRWRDNIKRLGLDSCITQLSVMSPWLAVESLISLPIDYLFIDGDHRTRWTIVDYHFWEPYVRPGGLIAFHDWTGANGVGAWVQRAVGIILEDDGLVEFTRHESNSRGIIVFKKPDGSSSFSRTVRRS